MERSEKYNLILIWNLKNQVNLFHQSSWIAVSSKKMWELIQMKIEFLRAISRWRYLAFKILDLIAKWPKIVFLSRKILALPRKLKSFKSKKIWVPSPIHMVLEWFIIFHYLKFLKNLFKEIFYFTNIANKFKSWTLIQTLILFLILTIAQILLWL